MNFVPAAREGAPLLMEGLISGYSMPGCIQSGTHFPNARRFGKCVPESRHGMGRSFQLRGGRKMRPGICNRNGIQFPNGATSGNRIPLRTRILGHSSRMQKGHMTWPSTYICCGYPQDKPRPNIRASVQAEAYKVHREFRTQRRPLNVASVLRRTVRARNLICLRPDRRFSYELAASRYLILVVPGARLGSVSLASVWKCSV